MLGANAIEYLGYKLVCLEVVENDIQARLNSTEPRNVLESLHVIYVKGRVYIPQEKCVP